MRASNIMLLNFALLNTQRIPCNGLPFRQYLSSVYHQSAESSFSIKNSEIINKKCNKILMQRKGVGEKKKYLILCLKISVFVSRLFVMLPILVFVRYFCVQFAFRNLKAKTKAINKKL
jgi:hypothetical protein